MKLITTLWTTACLLLPATMMAQTDGQFSLDAQIRARGEYNHGAGTPLGTNQDAAAFINNRVRLTMTYQRPGLTLKVAGQETGIWGEDNIKADKGHFGLHEAWAKLENNGYFLQMGRQTLVYDDERLLGGLDWHIAGNHHDALKVGYENEQHKVHAIFALNADKANDRIGNYAGGMPYKNMQTLWYHYTGKPLQVSLLFMNLGREAGTEEKADTKYMQTFGSYLTYKQGSFSANASVYGQTGKTAGGQTVEAFMVCGNAAYAFTPAWTLNAGADYLSGQDGKSDKMKAFSPLYGTHHKFYGAMDYFYASAWTTGFNPGLIDVNAGLAWKATSKTTWNLNYHHFSTGVKLDDMKRTLGSEIDLQFNCKVMKDVTLMGGYSLMFGTETMDKVKGGDHNRTQSWGWLSLNFTPRLFSSK